MRIDHYRISSFRRVPVAHGEAHLAHGENFAVGGRRRSADGSRCHGEESVRRVSSLTHGEHIRRVLFVAHGEIKVTNGVGRSLRRRGQLRRVLAV